MIHHNGQKKTMASSKSTKKSGEISDFSNLFEAELKDMLWVEKALVKAIPKMQKKASNDELGKALEEHLSVTEEHVTRLEQVFESAGFRAQAKECKAMKGILEEGEELLDEIEEGPVLDAAIISAAQKVEHYEITSYGTLCAFAKALGHDEALELLSQTLEEEKEADQTLSELAESSINVEAVQNASNSGEEEEEEEGDTMVATKKKTARR